MGTPYAEFLFVEKVMERISRFCATIPAISCTIFQGPQTPQGPRIVSRTTHLWTLKVKDERLSGSTDSTGSADCVTNHTSVDSESER